MPIVGLAYPNSPPTVHPATLEALCPGATRSGAETAKQNKPSSRHRATCIPGLSEGFLLLSLQGHWFQQPSPVWIWESLSPQARSKRGLLRWKFQTTPQCSPDLLQNVLPRMRVRGSLLCALRRSRNYSLYVAESLPSSRCP